MNYHDGRNIGSVVTNTLYHGGKGWTSKEFGYNGNTNRDLADIGFNTPNALSSSSAPNARLEVGLLGINNGAGGSDAHHIRLRYKNGTSYTEFENVYLTSYGYEQVSSSLSASLLSSGSIDLDAYSAVSGSTNQTSSDYSALSYMSLEYPHSLNVLGENLEQLLFKIPSSSNELHFNLANWGNETTTHLYDFDLKRRYVISQTGNSIKTNVSAGAERELFVQKTTTITELNASDFKAVESTGRFTDYSTLEKDSAFLIVTNRKLQTSAVQNISQFDFGEFYVHYWLTNAQGSILQSDTVRYDELLAGEVLFDSVAIITGNLNGKHTIWMEVNPQGEEWHKEQYSFNNTAYRTLTIDADNNNPLLDVTFEGIHILNGDIVSPNPEIVMELKDDNKFLLMDDTTSFDVFLTDNNQVQKRVPFVQNGQQIMVFEPATGRQNKARVSYRPEQLEDGTYQLSVMGRDASGNNSGNENYKIEFEVINQSMITNVMNYPNPFTTSTRFVFTLTGSRVPDVFTIQILTITGKVVREITKDEIGPINIGRNISQYAWDGTDEYGDRLANGVYMYHVIMKLDGQDIDRMESGADQYFKKDFGKMYLFR